MLPPFDEHGYLPPGTHAATLEEIEARFGRHSELRRVQMQSLRWMMDAARRAGVSRIIINGSFVTDVPEPNDVDCALLLVPGSSVDASAQDELTAGFPFLEIQVVEQDGFEYLIERFFATDRDSIPKGVVEVIR